MIFQIQKANNNKEKQIPHDSVRRSFAKAVSWRIIGTIDTFLLSFIIITFLGSWFGMDMPVDEVNIAHTAGYIAVAEIFTKLFIYSTHEQIWTRVRWGLSVAAGAKPESYTRSAIKTATWRVLASLDTMLLAWFFTGNFLTALSIGSFEIITKLVLYFIHERIWQKIGYGLEFTDTPA